MKLSYLGPANTFSEKAAKLLASDIDKTVELTPLSSMEAVARSLAADDTASDFAVLPYYNFLEGLVQECLDLIYDNRLTIIGARRVPVIWSLGRNPEGTGEDAVFSHPKALSQCSEYLWRNYPNTRNIATSSTSEAARIVKADAGGLAVAGREALVESGLVIVDENIGNQRHNRTNFTDFYLLSRIPDTALSETCEKFTMIAVTPYVDRPGLLAEILSQIAYHDLNNAKIHSRPALDEVAVDVEPQMFYLEIMRDRNDPDFQRCIDSIRYRLTPPDRDVEVVRVLGSYKRPCLM